jgi:preprotein translocase subunit SecE
MASKTSTRRRAITSTILVVGGVVLYFLSSGLMDWLRVTIHGR